jgi:3-deoxy-manno-octulosonate cytidylyltransferase (CMP-KDO synthetase)
MINSNLLRNIKLLILDVDGVLTDGGIYFGRGNQILRRFHVQDGQGIKSLQEKGIEVAIITGHHSEAVAQRSQQLDIKHVYQEVSDKNDVLEKLIQKLNIHMEEVAYLGDDLADLPVLKQVGFPIAVKNAVAEVKDIALYITKKTGGDGAVREVCDLVLKARNDDVLKAIGLIPVRYGSTRFPGKPLAEINGWPMVYHVYQQAQHARLLDEVIVATDDRRIVNVCEELGCKVSLTSHQHCSGTDRVAEIAEGIDADIIVNIQGDEPLIPTDLIDNVIQEFSRRPQADIVTARTEISHQDDIFNPNIVKVISSSEGKAIYFSRSVIPYSRGKDHSTKYYQHLGIYGYRRDALLHYTNLPRSPLEKAESLEQLRALENGFIIYVVDTDYKSIGVDTPSDIALVEKAIRQKEM